MNYDGYTILTGNKVHVSVWIVVCFCSGYWELNTVMCFLCGEQSSLSIRSSLSWSRNWARFSWIRITSLHCNSYLLNLFGSAGNSWKIWSACRQHGIQQAEWRMNRYRPCNFTCVFVCTSCSIKICNRKILKKKYKSQPKPGCRNIHHISTKWISSVMCAFINKLLMSFQNWFCQGNV